MDCLFCKIIAGEIPSTKVFENDDIYAFLDINPAAKVHLLVVPKIHVKDLSGISGENIDIINKIFLAIPQIAKQCGLEEKGYRVVSNVGEHGQQSVPHLHFHIIGGEQLKWELV